MYDFFTAFTAGIAIGIIIGHWASKSERALEYERGKLDGINLLWPAVESLFRRELAEKCLRINRDKAAGGNDSNIGAS